MHIITVTPFRCDLNLPTGVTEYSEDYARVVRRLAEALQERAAALSAGKPWEVEVLDPSEWVTACRSGQQAAAPDEDPRYLDLDKDNKDIRLAIVRYHPDRRRKAPEQATAFSLYNNTVGIVQHRVDVAGRRDGEMPMPDYVEALREDARQQTRRVLALVYYGLLGPVLLGLTRRARAHRFWRTVMPGFAENFFIPPVSLLLEPCGSLNGFMDSNEIAQAERAELAAAAGDRPEERARLQERLVEKRVAWFTFTLCLSRQDLTETEAQALLREWLSKTAEPGDADRIIAEHVQEGTQRPKDSSFTWLNYALVTDSLPEGPQRAKRAARLLNALHLAQYFYTAHDLCAANLQRALSGAYARKDTRAPEQILKQLRSRAEYNVIKLHDLRLELNQEKKAIFDQILAVWEYEELLRNTERLVVMTEARLEELSQQRQTRSGFLTDLILVAITFIGIFDLTVNLSAYGRELMAQPMLVYQDDGPSSVLAWFAEWDMDALLMGSFAIVLILFGLYAYAKSR